MRRRGKRKDSNIFEVFTQDQMNRLRETFNMLNISGNLSLEVNDVIKISESIGNPFSRQQIADMIGSKKITFVAFLTILAEKLSEIDSKRHIIEAFKTFDEKNTGYIDEKVLKHWLTQEGDIMSIEDVEYMFKKCSENGRVDYHRLTDIIKHGEVLDK